MDCYPRRFALRAPATDFYVMRKIMIKKILLFVFIFGAFISQVFAGGSFCLDIELKPILNQQPLIKDLVLETFDIAESGWAHRIGQQVNEKFGGRRLGPYSIKAKPKGQEGDYIFVHHAAINTAGFRTLSEGDRVSFEIEVGERGPAAKNVEKA